MEKLTVEEKAEVKRVEKELLKDYEKWADPPGSFEAKHLSVIDMKDRRVPKGNSSDLENKTYPKMILTIRDATFKVEYDTFEIIEFEHVYYDRTSEEFCIERFFWYQGECFYNRGHTVFYKEDFLSKERKQNITDCYKEMGLL